MLQVLEDVTMQTRSYLKLTTINSLKSSGNKIALRQAWPFILLRVVSFRLQSRDKDYGHTHTIRSAVTENPMLHANCAAPCFIEPKLLPINAKTYQFTTQCKGDISHAFKTAKITVFDPMMWKSPDVSLQAELLTLTIQLRTSQPSILAVLHG